MKRMNIFILLMAIFAIFITGCEARQTFSDDTLIGTPTPAPPTERQVKLIDSGPERGGTLRLFTTPVDTLNPLHTNNKYVIHISSFIFESLFVRTEENKVEPWLVEEWEHENFTNWSFTIKRNVKFHHGPELTSYDARHTIRLLENSDTAFFDTEFIKNIKEFNIITSRKFEIALKNPDEELLNKLTFPILSQTVESVTEKTLYGSGAYCLEKMDEIEITLAVNEKWWHEELPYIDYIIFKIFSENELIDAFQNKETDVSFIKNVDFDKYRYRTDICYQVYPGNEVNFLYVNPGSLFGQLNRQQALFGYVIGRIHEMNLGQVQYFEDYSDPFTIEEFREAMIQSGLSWDRDKRLFTYGNKPLSKIVIVAPEQDIQKLHTANFLVNILSDAGIVAEIKTMSNQAVKNAIRNGVYDLSPVTEEIRPWEKLADTIKRMQDSLGYGKDNSYILPLYRNMQATLFSNKIRGEKKSIYWNPYQGFHTWYMPVYKDEREE
ncbi:MAG: ABC transporter substrate-binding protein [Clostridiaceae bacterium]|nr:ABC transporter substrate-binding protein [Clostridiaceae bacterium]